MLADNLLAMLATLDANLRGLRDRAILLLGFAGGLRRSEIIGLDCGPEQTADGAGSIEMLEQGIVIRVRGGDRLAGGRGRPRQQQTELPGFGARDLVEARPDRPRSAVSPGDGRRQGSRRRAATDKHVARLVKRTALAAGLRGDLSEAEQRKKFSGTLPARRSGLRGRGGRAACAKAAGSCQPGDDAALSAAARSLPDQSDQGRGALILTPSPEVKSAQSRLVVALQHVSSLCCAGFRRRGRQSPAAATPSNLFLCWRKTSKPPPFPRRPW